MSQEAIKGCEVLLYTCAGAQQGDKVLVITDESSKEIGELMYNCASDFTAVSYTHLDVYKRQAISFVPPRFTKDACFEIIQAGIKFLVITAEGIPDHDVVDILAYAQANGCTVLGPGTAGVISPGKCKLGAHPPRMYIQGSVGLVSKSGALSYEIGKMLTEAGIGQSTVLAIGGGPIWGLTQKEVVELFEHDPETDIIVLVGEIGGTMEEEAAEFIAEQVTKPVVAMIVGRAAPKGKSLGHAGAIIEGNRGTAQAKIEACLLYTSRCV